MAFNPQQGALMTDVIRGLEARISDLEKRICIIEPDPKYPALQEAYREYKIIEKLTMGQNEQEA